MPPPGPGNLTTPQISRRYVVGTMLGRGGMGEVWRVRDRLRGNEVALKRIRPLRLSQRAAAASETLLLTQEFRLLAGLHHPNIIGVQDYGLDRQGWPYFTMRLLEGATTVSIAAATRDRQGRIRLLLQFFHGLAYLHRRGVIHRDLKPSNILVVGDQLFIVDFGLSITTDDASRVDALAGTMHYLAPELLENVGPSECSDVYSAGLIAFEVLTGKHAFRPSSRAHPDGSTRQAQPDFNDPLLGDGLGSILRQMLARNPFARPQDLGAIIALLNGLAGDLPVAPPEPEGRDGLARAAPLVGRGRDLGEIVLDLVAAADGTGRSRLILGMVGSGKTRLIEELRALALVRGALVVDGRNPAEAAQPFAPWREALRPLLIEQDVPDATAAVLRPLVPDIETLIGRTVGTSPELDPGGTLARLVSVIVQLVRGLGRTVVIAIEDLHWAGPESLELFAALVKSAGELPLLLLGTARGEEAPGLAEQLAAETTTHLRPLDAHSLAELAAGTIGPAGRSPSLIQMLVRESEGNPFFAVEVLRAAVERSGGWDRIGTTPLPEQLLVGGVRAVVARRLHRLSLAGRELIEVAAVTGRDLDPELLQRVVPSADWNAFLEEAARHGLIEPRAGRWSFMHDQLRMGVVDGIEPGRRRRLHHQIAQALGTGQSISRNAAELAYHWRQAEDAAEEARWTAIAGSESLVVGAYRVALTHSERVLELGRRFPRTFPAEIDLQEVRFTAGNAAFRAGDFPRAHAHLSSVLSHARRRFPTSTLRRIPHLLSQTAVQALHRLPGGSQAWFISSQRRRQCELLAQTWELLARLNIYAGDGLGILLCAVRASNLSENSGRPLPYAHSLIGVTAATARSWRIAQGYFQRSRAAAASTGDEIGLVDTLVMEGVSYLGAGRFEEALERLRSARLRAEELGYRLGQGQALMLEGVCHGYAADHLRMLTASCEGLECIRLHSHGHQPGFRCGQAKALILLGRFAEARATLEQARRLALTDDRLARSLVAASLLTVHLREDNLPAATRELAELETVIEGLTAIPPPCAILLEAPVELLIARWHLALRHGDPVTEIAAAADRWGSKLTGWARLFPIAQPVAAWFRGHQQFLQARQTEAWETWEAGREQAVHLGMPFYEAILSLTLSKHGPRNRQRQHRFRSRALFMSSQAMWHIRQLDESAADDGDGSRFKDWLADEGSGTRTAAYNLPLHQEALVGRRT